MSDKNDKPKPKDNPRLSAELPFHIISAGEEETTEPKPLKKGVLSPDQLSLSVKQRDRYNQLVQQGIDPKIARQLAIALTKSRQTSPYDKAMRELAAISKRAKPILKTEEVMRLTRDWANPSTIANAALRAARVAKGYASHFVAGAKDALPKAYFDQLHTSARGKAGGAASGMRRRANSDEAKQGLMEQRQQLKAQLADVEAQLAKSAPLAQEVGVVAPLNVAPKEEKRRKKLAERIAAQAMLVAKGKERVSFAVPAKILKTAGPDWKRIVHSVVYAPGDVDAHGDYMSAEDIEEMAHNAMRSGIYVNHEHSGPPIEADIVESYIAPQDFNLALEGGEPYHIPKGAFIQAMHVWGDEPWQKILKGEYVGYSLEGTALRDIT